jgi:hypothetical protein
MLGKNNSNREGQKILIKILIEDIKEKKVCAHFDPHFLIPGQEHQSAEFDEMIDDDRYVSKRIVRDNESWCFMYSPETKCQSATGMSPKKPKAQKVRMQKSQVHTMLTAFFMPNVSFIMGLC